MCLKVVSRVPTRLKFVNGRATVYKFFDIYNSPVIGKSLRSPYQYTLYKPGFTLAIDSHPSYRDGDDYIYGGVIHAYLSKNKLYKGLAFMSNVIVVPCTVYRKDFIAEGNNGDVAFKKIFISKETYSKALKSKSKYSLIRNY